MKKLLKFIIVTCVLTATLPVSIGQAVEPRVRHTLASGPNVYRVEIRNMHHFIVKKTNDNDGTDELHELIIQLRSHNPNYNTQSDGQRLYNHWLYNTRISRDGNGGYLEIRVGDSVLKTSQRPPRDTADLWVHVYSNPDDTEHNAISSSRRVTLTVHALELDCKGQGVCRRNSKGMTTISFQIPDFREPPSNRCGPENTFRLQPLDGEIQISGLSDTGFQSNTFLDGPELIPFNLDICIASTVKPRFRKPPEIVRDLIRSNRR